MAEKPVTQFGKRKPVTVQPAAPVKRSRHVVLLLTGTLAIGGGAYALMPSENCAPNQPGMTAPSTAGCSPRGSSSSSGGHGYWGGSSSRSSFFSGDSGSGRSSAGTSSSEAGSGGVTRGGFGSFAHAMGAHFSGGG
jgi:hypothetical protein